VSLADLNAELVLTYGAVRDEPGRVIEELASHKLRYDSKLFYELRKRNWRELSRAEAAARMIFLNRTGYNGLYRVNSKGEFNVPFGRYKNPRICDVENLTAASLALQAATLYQSSFEEVSKRARKGDLVYFDPPYVPLTSTANFVSYTSVGFSMEDQEKLADLFDNLSRRGVLVMLSNSSDAWVLERYKQYSVSRVLARRRVNSRADKRGPVAEVIVTSYPTGEG